MFSTEDQEKAKKAVSKLKRHKGKQNDDNGGPDDGNPFLGLTPSKLLVIAGLVGNVLEVDSVLVDRNQAVQIVLVGDLKRPTQLDKVMEQVGKMPFDQVMKSIMNSIE